MPAMRKIPRFLASAFLGAALSGPLAIMPVTLHAQDRVYHDKERNEDHHWDKKEDKAYRMYLKEKHRKYGDFARQKEEDQQDYWKWRHEHSDVVLKIH